MRRHRRRREIACALCPVTRTSRVRTKRRRLTHHPTYQRELLMRHLAQHHPGVDPNRPFCPHCLEELERRIHWRQLVEHRGEHLFVDLLLTPYPILPTPMRLNANPEYTGRGVTIAFVDSGFYPHDDLMEPHGRILAMFDAAGDGRIRRIGALRRRAPDVPAWHGTMTACAAAGNGFLSKGLYRGIASDADLVLVSAMTRWGGIHTPQVVRALRWIKRNLSRYDIRIVNLSIGVDEITDSLDHPVVQLVEELVARGVVVVAAAGNDPSMPPVPPAWAPSAITVGGYDDRNTTDWSQRSIWHSSYGQSWEGAQKPELLGPAIWLAAPILPNTGVRREAELLFEMARASDEELMRMIPRVARQTAIARELLRTRNPVVARSAVFGRIRAEKLINTSYKHVDGSSFAAPIVTSIVAQMLEARPALTPAEVKRILTESAVPLPDVPFEQQGYGVVQADRALAMTLAAAVAR